MQKARRARAVAIAQARDATRLVRLLLVCAGATAALLALPVAF